MHLKSTINRITLFTKSKNVSFQDHKNKKKNSERKKKPFSSLEKKQ